MKGRRYATLDEIKTASKEELKNILKNDFLKFTTGRKHRWSFYTPGSAEPNSLQVRRMSRGHRIHRAYVCVSLEWRVWNQPFSLPSSKWTTRFGDSFNLLRTNVIDSVRDDPNLLQRVITGDEAWVYGYDLSHEPRPKKASQVRSNVKVLLTVFFDCRGVVHHEFFPQGRTLNKDYYLQVMRNLREAIRQKRPDLLKNKNWLLHHDNAPAHTSLLVRDFLDKNNTLMMPQPPYSPDLAPCHFSCFLN
ncbi:CLCN3 [Cordylochernes scorpioides]|uniref:CLCN3 n=1 Tax=Cordylochernes scorpioides TaxID=51811 RepID=A0ABY6KV92_9ARAC|nr:CLCN3 [Cordylochernes scorpioides]